VVNVKQTMPDSDQAKVEIGDKGFLFNRKIDLRVLKSFEIVVENLSDLQNLRLEISLHGKRAERSQKRLLTSGSTDIESMLYCSLEQGFSQPSYCESRYVTLKDVDRVANSTAFLKIVASPCHPIEVTNQRTARFPETQEAKEPERSQSNSRNPSIKRFDRSEINKTFEEIEKIKQKRRDNRGSPEEEERMKAIKANLRHTPEIRKYHDQSLDRSKDSLEIQRDCELKSEMPNDPKRRRDYIANEIGSNKEPGDLKRFYSTRSENAYLRQDRKRYSDKGEGEPRPETTKESTKPVCNENLPRPVAEPTPKETKRRGVPEDQVEKLRKEISSMIRGLEPNKKDSEGDSVPKEASEKHSVLKELRKVILEEI
jgi:hypothetical protein